MKVEKEHSQKAAAEAVAEVAALKEEVAALKAAEQDTKMATLKAQVTELQALAAPSAALTVQHYSRAPFLPYAPSTRTLFLLRPHLHTCCSFACEW